MDADQYIRVGLKAVAGWLSAESARLIQVTSKAQVMAGTRGSVGEIGVHHGRLFILLYLLASPGERAFAIDVFEAQDNGVDRSGAGDRAAFEANLLHIGADMQAIDILSVSSLTVTPDQLRGTGGPVRLFSIDGGHTTDISYNDLRLAEATLADGGVVILDDVFQWLFPGVAAALARHLLEVGTLVPFAISQEKVLLTQPEHHDRLLHAVRTGMGSDFYCQKDFFGFDVALIRSPAPWRERVQLGVAEMSTYRRFRRSPTVGPVIEALRPLVLRAMRR